MNLIVAVVGVGVVIVLAVIVIAELLIRKVEASGKDGMP